VCDGDSVFAVHTLGGCDHADASRFQTRSRLDPFRRNMTTASSRVAGSHFWTVHVKRVAFLDRVKHFDCRRLPRRCLPSEQCPMDGFQRNSRRLRSFRTRRRLVDRLGPARVLAAGVIWWGIFTALTAAVPSGIRGALFLVCLHTLSCWGPAKR